tara:strand:+ start:118 stop:804 length:687 start_codon:yes stop_codon:yes gene_type:complete
MGYIGKFPTPQPLSATDIPDLPATKITSGTFPALNGSNLTNLDASDLTGTLPAISGANLTGVDGISEVDVWVLTNDNQNFTVYGAQDSSYMSRHSGSNFTHKGTGMTITGNSYWTFPSTGYWFVSLRAQWRIESTASCRGLTCRIDVSTDGGSSYNDNYALSQAAVNTFDSNNDFASNDAQCVIEVDNTSNVVIRGFWVSATASNEIDLSHDDPDQSTGWTFIKLRGL